MNRVTVTTLRRMKESRERITMLTAYDWTFARLLDEAGVEVILVGDSAAMVMLGHDTTLPVTMEEMLLFTRAAARGCQRAMVVADMPFMSYQSSVEEAVRNAGRFLKEAGAQAVKVEGGRAFEPAIRRMVESGIPVMGHLGLMPQTVHTLGGYKVQGRGPDAAERLMEEAELLQDAGVFSVVLECVPAELGARVSRRLSIPTIGIGAGPGCDGQVLVIHDLLGLYDRLLPKFVRRYANLKDDCLTAVKGYIGDVKAGSFPAEEHCFKE